MCSPSPPRLTNSNHGDHKRGDQHFFHVNACSLQNLRPNQFSAVGQGWLRNTRARWAAVAGVHATASGIVSRSL